MSKPASIQKIVAINKHPDADKLDLVTILGWQCVSAKDNGFKVGDLVCYIEIDSLVPREPWSEFLFAKSKPTDTEYRLKSIRLRKQLSQGLILPLKCLPLPEYGIEEGEDVSKLLGVTHYEKPIPVNLRGHIEGQFPTHIIPRTDEPRIQNAPAIIDYIKANNIKLYGSIKCDGTSLTVIKTPEKNYVCSRNLSLKEEGGSVYWDMVKKYDLLNVIPMNTAIQAEIVGPSIQDNRMGLKQVEIRIFNVYDVETHRYMDMNELVAYCSLINVPHVELILDYPSHVFDGLETLIEYSNNQVYSNGLPAEGIVWRPMTEQKCSLIGENGDRFSFKVISNKFLEKYGE